MTTIKCYFVYLSALYANRVLYGYKCDLEQLYSDMIQAYRLYNISENTFECRLSGDIIDEINKFKNKINNRLSTYCRDC